MPPNAPRETDPPPDDGQSLKTRLIVAARDLLEREGLDAATLRATARRAGVSHMAPYRHFKDKDELLAAVAEQGFREMTRFIDAAPGEGRARDAAGLAYVSFALDNPALYRLMFGANLSPRARFPGLVAAGGEAFARCVAASGASAEARAGEFLDHDDFGSNQSKITNLTDSKSLERDAGGKAVPAFPHPALEAPPGAAALWSIAHGLATLVIDGLIEMPPKGAGRDAKIAAILNAAR